MVIYPKDVETLTGRSLRTAQILLQQIRQKLGKGKKDFITVQEFAHHTGFSEEEIIKRL
jgi:hypothetical protein